MKLRLLAFVLVALAALAAWRSELWTVQRSGERPRPLVLLDRREPVAFDVALPAVPVGVRRLTAGAGPMLIHYWAPWERHGHDQIAALDSLARDLAGDGPRIVVVCFDPFPSVARFVARARVRVPVLLDHDRALAPALPCPSIPFTYGLDAEGRVAIKQSGEVDWLADSTRAAVRRLGLPAGNRGGGGTPPGSHLQ